MESCSNIVVVAGAGLSVSCGIPDFRSSSGLYASLDCHAMNLSCPEDLFDLAFFKDDPRPFWAFAKALYDTGGTVPSRGHEFLAGLQKRGKLLRVYTQNVDGLEERAGVEESRVVYCHGNTKSLACMKCRRVVDMVDDGRGNGEVMERIREGRVVKCKCRVEKGKAATAAAQLQGGGDYKEEEERPAKKPKLEKQKSRESSRIRTHTHKGPGGSSSFPSSSFPSSPPAPYL